MGEFVVLNFIKGFIVLEKAQRDVFLDFNRFFNDGVSCEGCISTATVANEAENHLRSTPIVPVYYPSSVNPVLSGQIADRNC